MKAPKDHRIMRRNEIIREGDLTRYGTLAWMPAGKLAIGTAVGDSEMPRKAARPVPAKK